MKLVARKIGCVLGVFLLFVPAAWGQTESRLAQGMWLKVAQLSPGKTVLVRTKDGRERKGTLENADELGLVVFHKQRIVNLTREEIDQVYLIRRRTPVKETLIGAGVGTGLFVAIHAVTLPGERAPVHGVDVPLFALSSGLGALVGYAAARKESGRELLYDAKVLAALARRVSAQHSAEESVVEP